MFIVQQPVLVAEVKRLRALNKKELEVVEVVMPYAQAIRAMAKINGEENIIYGAAMDLLRIELYSIILASKPFKGLVGYILKRCTMPHQGFIRVLEAFMNGEKHESEKVVLAVLFFIQEEQP